MIGYIFYIFSGITKPTLFQIKKISERNGITKTLYHVTNIRKYFPVNV